MEVQVSEKICKQLKTIHRTEDVCVSPSKQYIAFTGFETHKILILSINNKLNTFDKYLVISCKEFNRPHGVAWLDDNTLVVASRFSNTVVFSFSNEEIVDIAKNVIDYTVLKHQIVKDYKRFRCSCVRACIRSGNIYDIFVCSNTNGHVLQFTYDLTLRATITSNVLFDDVLAIPDGIALNKQKSLIAVTDYKHASTFIFNYSFNTYQSNLIATLKGAKFPHGVVFLNDDKILTTCGGTPYVYEYLNTKEIWGGEYTVTSKYRCVEEELFNKHHINEMEGGAKGIDVYNNYIITTCESTPFFMLKI